jgi:chromosome segregation ATPase
VLHNEDLMEQMNQLTSEFESLREQHQGTLSQVDFIKQKTEEENEHLRLKVDHFGQLKTILNSCLQIIIQFAKRFDSSSLIRGISSKRYKDVMSTYSTLKPVQDMYSLDDIGKKIEEFIKHSTDEIEVSLKTIHALKEDSQTQQQKVINLEAKCGSLTVEEEGLRERERYLKADADSLGEEKKKLEIEKNMWYKR